MNDCLVSVVIPVYNRENSIRGAVTSVLEQTYKDIEIIIVDDGSKDNTVSVIKSITDPRVKCLCKEHRGANAARNAGISAAHGEYIALFDSDDYWDKRKLEIQIEKMLSNKAVLSACNVKYCREDESHSETNNTEEGFKDIDEMISLYINSPCIAAKKSLFEKYKFDEDLRRWQDTDWLLRAVSEEKIYFIKDVLVYCYDSSNSIMKTTGTQRSLEALYYLCEKHETLMEEHSKIKVSFLKRIIHYKKELRLNLSDEYAQLYKYEKSARNLIKLVLSKLNLFYFFADLKAKE